MQNHTIPYAVVLTGLATAGGVTVHVRCACITGEPLSQESVATLLLVAAAQVAHGPNETAPAFGRRAEGAYQQVSAAKAGITLVTS